jgi:hypothetical protein
MPENRKPVPKSQQQLSNELTAANTVYGDPNLANPNFAGPNRSLQQSFEGDTVKPFTVGIQDIDEAIMYYFQNIIRPFVMQNGQRIEVPIIYGSPERWKSAQKDGYYKDKNGAIMSPLIMFKRNTIAKNRSIGNKLDSNYPNLYGVMKKKYDTRNFYSNFNVLTNRIPEEQFYAVAIPDYITVTYSCIVYTYYQEQLNKIIEAMEYASDSYWGNPQRYQFQARIDSFNTIQELKQGEERIIRGNFDLKIYGYIIPDTVQKNVSSLKKFNNKTKLIFSLETTDDPLIFDPNIPVQMDDSGRPDARAARSLAADKYNIQQGLNNVIKQGYVNFQPNVDYGALLEEIASLQAQLAAAQTTIQQLQNP